MYKTKTMANDLKQPYLSDNTIALPWRMFFLSANLRITSLPNGMYRTKICKAALKISVMLFLSCPLLVKSQVPMDEHAALDKNASVTITPEMKQAEIDYNEKIVELYKTYTNQGFELQHESRINLESNLESQVYIQLVEGKWYHFVYVGDPLSEKIKVKLFLDGAGTLVEDILRARQTDEFWTHFSFICPASGMYEFSMKQNSTISRPLSYLMLFAKKQ